MMKTRLFPSRKRNGGKIFNLSKSLLGFGCASFFIFTTVVNVRADDQSSSSAPAGPQTPISSQTPVSSQTPIGSQPSGAQNPYTTPLPDNSLTPDVSQSPNSAQNPNAGPNQNPNSPNADTSQNPNGQNSGTLPDSTTTTPGTVNLQATDVPLLPQQPSNPALQQNVGTGNTQSAQITAPSLYTTGTYDLSQIASGAALEQAFAPAQNSTTLPTGPLNPLRLGPFDLKGSMNVAVVADDNIFAGQGGTTRDSDTTIAYTPAVLLQYGNHEGQRAYASIVYAPMLTRYFQASAENSDDQNVAVNIQYPFQRLTLNLTEAYTQVTGVNQDLNARTTQTSNVATFGGTYDINDKLTATANIQELTTMFKGPGQNDDVTSINTNVSYRLTDKITLGPSFNIGYETPAESTHQTFEQALFGASYQPTEKITVVGQAGVEFRQYDSGGDSVNPLFSAGVTYRPFDSTTLTLNGNQTVAPSTADSDQTSVSTGVGFTVSQRIIQRVFLGFSFSYDHSEYKNENGDNVQSGTVIPVGGATNQTVTLGSTQDNLAYRPSITYIPSDWLTAALYYQYRDNSSNSPTGGYHDNQFGVSMSAQF
jgi:hypothetical protein